MAQSLHKQENSHKNVAKQIVQHDSNARNKTVIGGKTIGMLNVSTKLSQMLNALVLYACIYCKISYLSAFIKISLGIYQKSNTKALSCYLLKSYVAHLNSINSSIRQSTKITWTLVKRNVTFDSAASLLFC